MNNYTFMQLIKGKPKLAHCIFGCASLSEARDFKDKKGGKVIALTDKQIKRRGITILLDQDITDILFNIE